MSENSATTPRAHSVPPTDSISSLASDWMSAKAERLHALTELAFAEARLASISIALMVFLAMLAAAFVLGAWGMLVAAAVYSLLQAGQPLWAVMLALGFVHIGGALLLWRSAVRLSRHVEFRATRGQFAKQATEASS